MLGVPGTSSWGLKSPVWRVSALTRAEMWLQVGSFSNVSGADNSSTCLQCPGGKFSEAPGQAQCVDCQAGYFSGAVGANSSEVCAMCPAGTNSSMTGADAPSDCEMCPVNTYSPSGASACRTCPSHTVSRSGSKTHTDCKCAPGYNGPDGGPCLGDLPEVLGPSCVHDSFCEACIADEVD